MRLHVHEWVDSKAGAPALVCLHGVTLHGGHFRQLAEERLASRYRVVAPDLRGHGRSGSEPPWTLETHLEDVLETVGDEPRVWVGHSLGGRIVLELAARHPELVERAVLLDPAIRLPPDLALRLAETERADESRPPKVRSRLFHTPLELLEEDRRDNPGWCKSAVVTAFSELARRPPPFPRVATLLVLGRDESVVGPNRRAAYAAALGALLTVREVPGGHTVLWDAFDETAAAMENWLAAD